MPGLFYGFAENKTNIEKCQSYPSIFHWWKITMSVAVQYYGNYFFPIIYSTTFKKEILYFLSIYIYLTAFVISISDKDFIYKMYNS